MSKAGKSGGFAVANASPDVMKWSCVAPCQCSWRSWEKWTSLAPASTSRNDEFSGQRGDGYRRMLELSPVGRAGAPDEIATLAALVLGADGRVHGSDFLVDGASPPPTSTASVTTRQFE
jgi:NAD(P)-dependent dehydrogenase (short-subunit alcohol dehydrogenase family)